MEPEISKKDLEKELDRYIKEGDTFTARNLLKNFGKQIEDFPTAKYLKIIEKEENLNKENKEA